MNDNPKRWLLILMAGILLYVSVTNVLLVPGQYAVLASLKSTKPQLLQPSVAIARIDKAIKVPSISAPIMYSDSFEIPFKDFKVSRPVSQGQVIERKKLFLKGILLKNVPLAILENETGETQIRAAGDTAFEQIVIKIGKNSVTLRDKRGPYEIVVEE